MCAFFHKENWKYEFSAVQGQMSHCSTFTMSSLSNKPIRHITDKGIFYFTLALYDKNYGQYTERMRAQNFWILDYHYPNAYI